MHAFATTKTRGRSVHFGCTKGEIHGNLHENRIRFERFLDGREEFIHPGRLDGGHAGGDTALMRQFIESIRSGDPSKVSTNVEQSLESHLLAFAAEESRQNGGKVVEMDEYRQRIEREVSGS